MRTAFLIAVSIALVFVLSGEAGAYIDPGTGSYLLQILIAGLVGAAFAVKMFWRNVTGFVARLFGRRNAPPKTDDTP